MVNNQTVPPTKTQKHLKSFQFLNDKLDIFCFCHLQGYLYTEDRYKSVYTAEQQLLKEVQGISCKMSPQAWSLVDNPEHSLVDFRPKIKFQK